MRKAASRAFTLRQHPIDTRDFSPLWTSSPAGEPIAASVLRFITCVVLQSLKGVSEMSSNESNRRVIQDPPEKIVDQCKRSILTKIAIALMFGVACVSLSGANPAQAQQQPQQQQQQRPNILVIFGDDIGQS